MPDSKPNILVIWGDDIGITNLSCYSDGLMGYRTPNIDRIAARKTVHAVANRGDAPDDLMAWHDRKLRIRQVAIDHVQVGAAHAAREHLEQRLGR